MKALLTVMVMGLGFGTIACTNNAILELTLNLPTSPAPRFALTQIRRADEYAFDTEWAGDDPPAIPLTEQPTQDQISVESHDEATDLRIKIRFCVRSACDDLQDDLAPEFWAEIEHPFYIGERTNYTLEVLTLPEGIPASPVTIGRCDIAGCIAGEASSYCRVSDGTHFCEEANTP